MKYHNPEKELKIGSYYPSSDINKFTHYAIMEDNGPDEMNGGLVATVGYFHPINAEKKWGVEDYTHAAECIEQGQLYANAHKLFAFIQALVKEGNLPKAHHRIAIDLLCSIEDISEPINRLLGKDGMTILQAIENHQKNEN